MKIKPTIVIILMLLMIASNFTIGAAAESSCEDDLTSTGDETGDISVTKEVWDSIAEKWVSEITAELGETVRFRINVAYLEKNPASDKGYRLAEIYVKDTLPNYLGYANDAKVYFGDAVISGESSVDGKVIRWNLSEEKYNTSYYTYNNEPGIQLALQPTPYPAWWADVPNNVTIEFNATVVGYGVNVNSVEVDATEHCSGLPMYGSAEATIIVEEPQCGSIDVTKKIFDGCEWTDSYKAEVGEDVLFNITITYHAGTGCGENLTDIVVTDNYSIDGVLSCTIHDFSYAPSEQHDSTIIWNLTDDFGIHISDGKSVSIEFEVTPTSVEGLAEFENCVDVNAIEHCCECQLSGYDCANFTVEEPPCEPEIEVEKYVWNGSAWSDYVDDIHLNDIISFKIVITYNSCGSSYEILNMVVVDDLPCCLEYLETTNVSTTREMDQPNITVKNDGKSIVWDWVYNNHVVLHNGDSLTIEFNTVVTNYCDMEDKNWAYVEAWGCSGPYFYGEDYATVNCTPPVPKFSKKAFDGQEWVHEIEVSKGETIRFKLEFEYYGETVLDEVKFVDILPCILEYAGNVRSNRNLTVELSEDGKTIWFNLIDDVIEDGEIVTIEFDALVTGTTGECCECEYVENYAYVTGKIGCVQEPNFFMDDKVRIVAQGNCPPTIPAIRGPTTGTVGESLTFYFVSMDPDEDNVSIIVDWDVDYPVAYSPMASGEEKIISYTFDDVGTYKIKAKARDENGAESGWTPAGYEHVVVITEAPPNESVELSVKMAVFGFGRVKATVTNTGDVDLTDINWEINATGGLLKRVTIYNNGTIETLNTGKNIKISSSDRMFGRGSSHFGFGKLTGQVKLTAGNYTKIQEFKGFIIGKIIIIPQLYTIQ